MLAIFRTRRRYPLLLAACLMLLSPGVLRRVAGELYAQEHRPDSTMLSAIEFARLMDSLRANPYFVLLTAHPRAAAFIRAGLERLPTDQPWGTLASMLCGVDGARRRQLSGADRVAAYQSARRCLEEFSDQVGRVYQANANSRDARGGYEMIQETLAESALESGALEEAARIATALLRRNTDTTWMQYGSIIHNANQLLGRVALRSGSVDAAKSFLLAAGRTHGGLGLAGFGPSLFLARELLERGEREVVLQYLELVSHPRYDTYSLLHPSVERWKTEIREGRIPQDVQWR